MSLHSPPSLNLLIAICRCIYLHSLILHHVLECKKCSRYYIAFHCKLFIQDISYITPQNNNRNCELGRLIVSNISTTAQIYCNLYFNIRLFDFLLQHHLPFVDACYEVFSFINHFYFQFHNNENDLTQTHKVYLNVLLAAVIVYFKKKRQTPFSKIKHIENITSFLDWHYCSYVSVSRKVRRRVI